MTTPHTVLIAGFAQGALAWIFALIITNGDSTWRTYGMTAAILGLLWTTEWLAAIRARTIADRAVGWSDWQPVRPSHPRTPH